jgi:hypothetical protein
MSRDQQRPPPRPIERAPICPERVRAIGGESFAFVPHRFLRHGFFAALTADERGLYFFLVLAADRFGVSFYHYDTICSVLQLPLESYLAARNGLIAKDLIAFDGTRFQVLALPEKPLPAAPAPLQSPAELADHDSATIRSLIQRSLPPRL